MKGTIAISILLLAGIALRAATAVNADAAIVQDFEKRVNDYMQIHKDLESKLPRLKSTVSQAEIRHHQRELGNAIRAARASAKPGDIFTPPIATEFRRLVGLAMQGRDTGRIERSMKSAEPVRMALKVNDSYPSGIPRQSTPPTLLMNLPQLPPDLEFRIVGNGLILLDSKANLVVDVLPNAVP